MFGFFFLLRILYSLRVTDSSACIYSFLKFSFVTVLNKLIYSHKLVLKPYAAALQNTSGDESLVRIQHLERLLEQNTEQRETLTRLMAQGYIDQVLYNSETNPLLTQANTVFFPLWNTFSSLHYGLLISICFIKIYYNIISVGPILNPRTYRRFYRLLLFKYIFSIYR